MANWIRFGRQAAIALFLVFLVPLCIAVLGEFSSKLLRNTAGTNTPLSGSALS
jgi:hypothetical protein